MNVRVICFFKKRITFILGFLKKLITTWPNSLKTDKEMLPFTAGAFAFGIRVFVLHVVCVELAVVVEYLQTLDAVADFVRLVFLQVSATLF